MLCVEGALITSYAEKVIRRKAGRTRCMMHCMLIAREGLFTDEVITMHVSVCLFYQGTVT